MPRVSVLLLSVEVSGQSSSGKGVPLAREYNQASLVTKPTTPKTVFDIQYQHENPVLPGKHPVDVQLLITSAPDPTLTMV